MPYRCHAGSVAVAALVLFATAPATVAAPHDPVDGAGHDHAPLEAVTATATVRLGSGSFTYESVPGWCRLPDERPLGNTHGQIVIDADGRVYFNTDTDRSFMVYAPDGTFVRHFGDTYPAVHGMVVRREGDTEYIYAAHLRGKRILKLKMDGEIMWSLGVPSESGKYDDDANAYNPTGIAVADDGTIFVADGYGRNWIHQFAPDRTYVRSFGGHGEEPGRFRTCHGIAIDRRGEKPYLLVCDRENRRLQRFTLDGEHVDVAATDLRRPCSVSFWGEYVAVAELEGRVTILDDDFAVVAHIGDNPRRNERANNGVPPDAWVEGVFTAPHACCFDSDGNLYVMDWNAAGRISKLVRKTTEE